MTKSPRIYGWKPDAPDPRDHRFGAGVSGPTPPPVKLPPTVDLRDAMPPVYDQASLGSCTANADGALFEYLQTRAGMPAVPPSRLFLYYGEREAMGTINEDSGASIRDGIKVLANLGCPPETVWPYDVARFAERPPVAAYAAAAPHKIASYQRLNQTASHLRMALTMGFPVAFGFTVYPSFESKKVASTGRVPMPGRFEPVVGGHAVLIVGFDHRARVFIVRNSWGAGWGMDGYFTIPYAYVLNDHLSSDFWTAQLAT